jgi:hypothetical protein
MGINRDKFMFDYIIVDMDMDAHKTCTITSAWIWM